MKKLFTTCAVLAAASLIVFSCKKSSNTTTTASSTTSTTGTSATPPTAIFMLFNLFQGGSVSTGASAAPLSIIGTVDLGTVVLDSKDTLTNTSGQYSYSSSLAFSGKPTWKITGGSTATAFTYNGTKTIPNVSSVSFTVNSFSKSANLVLSNSVVTADTIKYTITDDVGTQVTKSVVASSTGFTFTPAMLTPLSNSSNASVEITGITYEYSVQGGKKMLFINNSQYTKSNVTITN